MPKKQVGFEGVAFLPSADEFDEKYGKLGIAPYPEGYGQEMPIEPPDFVEPILKDISSRYQIYWTRYDGKEIYLKLPERKWWNNIKRLIPLRKTIPPPF